MTQFKAPRRLWIKRSAVATATGGTFASLYSSQSAAQANISKIIVGFAAGGSLDLLARIAAEGLSSKLGRSFIVENRIGASGRLAVEAIKNSKPDGENLLICPQGPLTLFPYVFKNLKFDPFKDLTPIARLSNFDVAISVGPASGADSMQKFIAWLKSNPDKANFGSSGAGTLLHFTGTSIAQKINIPLTHVGYKGSAPAVVDLIAGTVPMVVTPLSDALEFHKNGKLKVIAVSSAQRSVLAPDVPTLKEVGVDLEVPGWFALYGPAGLSADLAKKHYQAVLEILSTTPMKERLNRMGMTSAVISPEETLQVQRREFQFWGPLIKSTGFTPED